MAIPVSDKGGDFEKPSIGTVQAVCAFVHDIGLQKSSFAGKDIIAHKVIISWELSEKMTKGEQAGKPFMVSKYYTASLNEKANLRKDLESWRGQSFTEDELKSFDLERLVGINCLLNIMATEKDKRKIAAVMPIPKGMEPLRVFNIAPSQKYVEWIEKERMKAVAPEQLTDISDKEPDTSSGLPF